MVGQIKDGKIKEGYHMLHNSVAIFSGNQPKEEAILFPMKQDTKGREISVFPVRLPPMGEDEYFWLGDGFYNQVNGNTYIFAYRVVDHPEWVDELFKFEVLGGALIVLPAGSFFPYHDQYQLELPFFRGIDDGNISFGAGIFENTSRSGTPDPDGYIYIYGMRDPGKQLLVSRVRSEHIEDFAQWQFYDGSTWQSEFENCAAVSDSLSNELSVSVLPNGQYALVFQVSGLSTKVGMRLGSSPLGPFGPIEEIWDSKEALKEPEFFAYNAKAHPTLSKPGELLISYNVNSFAFWDQIEDYPHLYRPRFFKLIFK
jgi:hypothetical protein